MVTCDKLPLMVPPMKIISALRKGVYTFTIKLNGMENTEQPRTNCADDENFHCHSSLVDIVQWNC